MQAEVVVPSDVKNFLIGPKSPYTPLSKGPTECFVFQLHLTGLDDCDYLARDASQPVAWTGTVTLTNALAHWCIEIPATATRFLTWTAHVRLVRPVFPTRC